MPVFGFEGGFFIFGGDEMRPFRSLVLSSFTLALFCALAFAAVPQTITHQGYLADTLGAPVNASVDMTFAIYDVESDGTALWLETQTVQVTNGIYAVALGAVTPLDAAIVDGDLWLGVKVDVDTEMSPRQKLGSVSFALRAALVDQAATVVDGAVTETKIADGAVTDAKIVGPIDASKISEIATLQSEVASLQAAVVALQGQVGDSSNIRFVDNGDGTVTDTYTDLVWLKDANCFGLRSWSNAKTNVDALADGQCGLTDGSQAGDWRMPNENNSTLVEFRHLFDSNYSYPPLSSSTTERPWKDGDTFTNVQIDYPYWTNTANGSSNHFTAFFSNTGSISYTSNTIGRYVWPVRKQ